MTTANDNGEHDKRYNDGERFFKSLPHAVQVEIRDTAYAATHPLNELYATLGTINKQLGRDPRAGVALGEFVSGIEKVNEHPETKVRNMKAQREKDELREVLDKHGVGFEPKDVDNLSYYFTKRRIDEIGIGRAT